MFYRTSEPHGLRHNPFKSLVVPRPIGWISSLSPEGVVNLAPFSFFNAVSEHPPIVYFSPYGQHLEGGAKDSPHNIAATGEFVVNIVSYDLREAMNATAAMVGRAVDEMDLAKLEKAPSHFVRPPRVKASPAALECRHIKTVELPTTVPDEPNNIIFGEVVGVYIDDAIITAGKVDMKKMRPIARLGYHDYTVVDTVFSMIRPA